MSTIVPQPTDKHENPADDPHERLGRALARIATLEAERDKAREECGHEKAMRASIRQEMGRFIQLHLECKRTHAVASQDTLPLRAVLAHWRVGSNDWSWRQEFNDLRERDGAAIDQLATSVQETGMREPILLGVDGRIWDGHHRLCVAQMLGLERVPVVSSAVQQDGDDA